MEGFANLPWQIHVGLVVLVAMVACRLYNVWNNDDW
jgi:hypothetical protein